MPSLSHIDQNTICNMLPHTGSMCLLDGVDSWDKQHIVCHTRSHLNKDNPLQNAGELPMISLMEYGAQAMAVHGCLLAQSSDVSLQEGYLAALRDVKVVPGDLSKVEETLFIRAEKIHADNASMIYTLSMYAGDRQLASARATAVGSYSQGKTS